MKGRRFTGRVRVRGSYDRIILKYERGTKGTNEEKQPVRPHQQGEAGKEETMTKQYAVNIADLTKDLIISRFLIADVVPNRIIVDAEKGRLDGGAILLECEGEKARAIIDIVRKKYQKHDFRFYEKGTTWKRI